MKESARFSRFFLFLAIILVAGFISPKHVFATLSACAANIDTQQMDINSNPSVVFDVTNEDQAGGTMYWIKITVPSSNFTIENYGDSETFTGFGGSVGTAINLGATIDAGGTADSSRDWLVQASDDSGGADPTTCTGNLGTQIIDPNTYHPAQISNVTASNVTDTSVTLSFTTDVDATTEIDYGASNYNSNKKESSAGTSHSFILDSLTANTTYGFIIKAVNDSGEADSNGMTFVTAATPYVTSVPQVINTTTTVTTTTVKTLTPTPTPTPVPDITPPAIYISTDFSKPFAQSPQVLGNATDNKEVAKMDYSLDGGHNWLPVDNVPNAGKSSTVFSFTPAPLDDGNYSLIVRGIDASGNIGISKVYTLVIDRLPPQASGVLFSLGPQIINPKSDGTVVTLAGQPLKITLSDVGGATSAAILAMDLSGKNSPRTFFLSKDLDNGLWSGTFSLKTGNYQLVFSAIDGASNKTTRNLNKIVVVSGGRIDSLAGSAGVANAKITVYYQEPVTNSWQIWDAGAYSQINPQISDGNGNYSLFLPPGKYYLHIEGFGFKTTDTEFFAIDSPQPINASFTLSPLKLLFSLGPIRIYLPDFSILSVPFKNNIPSDSAQASNNMIGKNTPFFNLAVSGQNSFSSDSLMGKPSVLTFLNTWSPASTEQISILDQFAKNKDFNSTVVVEGEKVSKVYVFQKRGGYSLPVFADPDATLAIPYNLSFLPVHYFLDRKGVVKKVIYGALNKEELANTLVNISQ
jgi:hypothetical protein